MYNISYLLLFYSFLELYFFICTDAQTVDGFEWVPFNGNDFDGISYPHPSYAFAWRVDTKKDEIEFICAAKTEGWVGHGYSPTGGMKGADVVVLELIGKDWVFTDRHATDYAMPIEDVEQNYKLIKANRENGVTYFTYTRSISICDKDDLAPREVGGTNIIFAFGDDDTFKYHGRSNRGQTLIYLFNDPKQPPPLPDSTSVITLDTGSFTIPSEDTTYACFVHRLPIDKKYHILRYNYQIDTEYVHHIFLYACTDEEATDLNLVEGQVRDCLGQQMCSTPLNGWAVGSDTEWFYDEGFGMPFGIVSPEEEPVGNYLIYEVHYNNPTNDEGVVDNTIVELTTTDDVGEHDMGLFIVGLAPHEEGLNAPVIPPGEDDFQLTANCPNECIKDNLPIGGITIQNVFLHMHDIGTKIKLQHIRNGKEIDPIYSLDWYDFNFQKFAPPFGGDRLIESRDRFRVVCEYDSSSRSNDTIQGFETQDEMCLAFFEYYPRIPGLSGCLDLHENNELDLSDIYVCFDGTIEDDPILQPGLIVVDQERLEYTPREDTLDICTSSTAIRLSSFLFYI